MAGGTVSADVFSPETAAMKIYAAEIQLFENLTTVAPPRSVEPPSISCCNFHQLPPRQELQHSPMARRLSKEDKGKSIFTDGYKAPRKPSIRAQAPDNTALLNKYSLTLIGRVTNQTAQKVWSLIPFFTELWKAESRPVGSDLGNGLFQFQFSNETDLLAVLEKRPYHYARWMVIVQRWEPTVSKDFPSLLPFWIKVQGIPIHLWSEETVTDLGENLGIFDKLEITQTTVRMRVQVNGLLPYSVIEYSNGDEVTATFLDEKLEKHCSKCFRLDHEIRDCLIAKHQAREAKGRELDSKDQAEIKRPTDHQPLQRSESDIYHFSAANPNGDDHDHGHRRERSYDYREHKYDARRNLEERRRYRSSQDTVSRRYSRHASKERQGSFDSRYSHHKDPNPPEREVTSRAQREHHDHRETSFSSPPRRGRSETRGDEQVVVNDKRAELGRNYPIREQQAPNPQEVLNEARAEVRETMLQYTQCADPTESAARRERMRIAEEKGQLEKSAIRIAQANLGGNDTIEEEPVRIVEKSASRTPAVLRLGPPQLTTPFRGSSCDYGEKEAETTPGKA
ncbi:hypothetical protein Bca101_007659 [Brassica carinata]